MEGRTTVIVAHRLSTVMNADVVVVLDGGCVAAVGTHTELVTSNATYRTLVAHQMPLPASGPGPATGGGDDTVAERSELALRGAQTMKPAPT